MIKNPFLKKFVIITGASLGLGKAMAKNLASKGCNLILLSLPGEGLCDYCDELFLNHGVQVFYYETDLREAENILKFREWVLSKGVEIAGLINNAGLGGSAFFDETPFEQIDTMVLVNVRALTLMSRLFIPLLKRQEPSFILNVSSIAAFKPMPFKTVYPASKAYVYSFSVGLGEELKDTSVQVSVLHPGPMDTSQENASRLNKHGLLGRLVLLTVDEVAGIAINRLFAGKKVIIPGIFNRICIRLLKTISRRIAMPILSTVLKKETLKDVEKQEA